MYSLDLQSTKVSSASKQNAEWFHSWLLHSEDGGRMILRNSCKFLPGCTTPNAFIRLRNLSHYCGITFWIHLNYSWWRLLRNIQFPNTPTWAKNVEKKTNSCSSREAGHTTWAWKHINIAVMSEATCYIPAPLWSSGQSSWLQIQRSGFHYRRYQIFWEVGGLERGSLSLVSTT
jgi:hypothetical protein